MKRTVILPALAIILLAVIAGGALLLLLLVLPIAMYFVNRRAKTEQTDELKTYADVDEVTRQYGEPDHVVVLDATRANELSSLILAWPSRDVVVVEGRELKLSDLKSVVPKNMATPYTIDEYAVIIKTRNSACPTITHRVGYDARLAAEISAQIDVLIRGSKQSLQPEPAPEPAGHV